MRWQQAGARARARSAVRACGARAARPRRRASRRRAHARARPPATTHQRLGRGLVASAQGDHRQAGGGVRSVLRQPAQRVEQALAAPGAGGRARAAVTPVSGRAGPAARLAAARAGACTGPRRTIRPMSPRRAGGPLRHAAEATACARVHHRACGAGTAQQGAPRVHRRCAPLPFPSHPPRARPSPPAARARPTPRRQRAAPPWSQTAVRAARRRGGDVRGWARVRGLGLGLG